MSEMGIVQLLCSKDVSCEVDCATEEGRLLNLWNGDLRQIPMKPNTYYAQCKTDNAAQNG